MRYIRKSKEKE